MSFSSLTIASSSVPPDHGLLPRTARQQLGAHRRLRYSWSARQHPRHLRHLVLQEAQVKFERQFVVLFQQIKAYC